MNGHIKAAQDIEELVKTVDSHGDTVDIHIKR